MLELPVEHLRSALHAGFEHAGHAGVIDDESAGEDLDLVMFLHPLDQIADKGLDIVAFEGLEQFVRDPAQLVALFRQIDLKALIGKTQGGGHAGNSTPDYQDVLVHRQTLIGERLSLDCRADRHLEEILGFGCRLGRRTGMDPGGLIADVGDLHQVLVETCPTQEFLEFGLVGAGRTAADDHPVELLFLDGFTDILHGDPAAAVAFGPGNCDMRKGGGMVDQVCHVDDTADVLAAVADKDPDLRLFPRDITFFQKLFLFGCLLYRGRQIGSGHAGGGAGLNHGLRNVFRRLKGPGHVNAGPSGGYRVEALGHREEVAVQFHTQLGGERPGVVGGLEAGGEHDHVEMLFKLLAGLVGGVEDGQIGAAVGLQDGVRAAAHKTHPVLVFGPLQVQLVILAEGPHIHIEDGCFDILLESLLGDDRLLQGEHAAGMGTVSSGTLLQAPRADALEPGDLLRREPGRRTEELAAGGTGGGEDTFVFEARHHIRQFAVTEVIEMAGIKQRGPRREDDGGAADISVARHVIRVDCPGRTDAD